MGNKGHFKGHFIETSFYFDETPPSCLKNRMEDKDLYNQPDLLFLEEKYINDSDRFNKIIKKFKLKKFNKELKVFRDGKINALKDFSDEVILYSQVVSENNKNGIKNDELNISVNHFSEYEQSNKVRLTQLIFILLFIANFTDYDNNNKFQFKVKLDTREFCDTINFPQIIDSNMVGVYNWVISSKENLNTRLRIIREIIIEKQSFYLNVEDLVSAQSLFNRIIKEETDKYFFQVNALKEDFSKINDKKQASYNSLHLKFLGWIGAIGIFIYDELKDYDGKNLLYEIFFSSTDKTVLFIILFLLGISIIWIIFVKENSDNRKELEYIKSFYVSNLFFENNYFQKYDKYFCIPHSYTIIFSISLLLLFLRLILGYIF